MVGGECVVPVAVEFVAVQLGASRAAICLSVILMPRSYVVVPSSACTVSPAEVVVPPRVSMVTSWDCGGLPRQLRLIAQNSRCSIAFHLKVPGVGGCAVP